MGYLVPQTGYESAGLPRGGGWGNVTNITFSNVNVQNATRVFSIDESGGDNGSYAGTSKVAFSNIYLDNFFGNLSQTTSTATISCSSVVPCHDIYFTNMTVKGSNGSSLKGQCKYQVSGTIYGLSGC